MAKNHELHIRIDQLTRDALIHAAAKDQNTENPNISKYLRKLILENDITLSQEVAAELHILRNQVIRIGNNLNQMARVANETGMAAEVECITKEMNALYKLFETVQKSMANIGDREREHKDT